MALIRDRFRRNAPLKIIVLGLVLIACEAYLMANYFSRSRSFGSRPPGQFSVIISPATSRGIAAGDLSGP
jgi:hypothetical protein